MPGMTGVHVNSPSNKVSIMTKQQKTRTRTGTLPSGAKYKAEVTPGKTTISATKGNRKTTKTNYDNGKLTIKSTLRTGKIGGSDYYSGNETRKVYGTTTHKSSETMISGKGRKKDRLKETIQDRGYNNGKKTVEKRKI